MFEYTDALMVKNNRNMYNSLRFTKIHHTHIHSMTLISLSIHKFNRRDVGLQFKIASPYILKLLSVSSLLFAHTYSNPPEFTSPAVSKERSTQN